MPAQGATIHYLGGGGGGGLEDFFSSADHLFFQLMLKLEFVSTRHLKPDFFSQRIEGHIF